MSQIIIKAEQISKQYRLGLVGTGTLKHDINRFWHKIHGKEDPYLQLGEVNDRSVKASRDYVWALQDINFEVKRGEVLGIIGKNGAGKSTLLKLLSRVTSPTTGTIKSRGRIASLLEVGTGFHPELTGRENIYLNGAILGMTKAEIRAKIDEIIDFSGCEKYIDTPTKRYSSGMTVRLGFAVAAHLEPDILVVDEVLAVGDAEFQKKAIGKMQDISSGQGRTVLFVSHNMGSIQALCSRAILLNNGGIKFSGDTDVAVEQYMIEASEKNKSRGIVNLDKTKNRKGTGLIRFKEVSVYTRINKEKLTTLMTGKPAEILFKFRMMTESVLSGFVVSIGFYNQEGSFLFACRSDSIGATFRIENEADLIRLRIPKFPLVQGTYSYSLICYHNGEIQDWIKNAGLVYVEEGDFYGFGKLPGTALKGVLIDYEYEAV